MDLKPTEKNDEVEVPVKKDYLNFVIKYCVLALWVILYILRLKSNEEKESIYKKCKQLFFGGSETILHDPQNSLHLLIIV